jgi:hypothetical protein
MNGTPISNVPDHTIIIGGIMTNRFTNFIFLEKIYLKSTVLAVAQLLFRLLYLVACQSH